MCVFVCISTNTKENESLLQNHKLQLISVKDQGALHAQEMCRYLKVYKQGYGLTSVVVMNSNLCQHSIVLYLGLPDRRAVVGNDNKFCCNTQQNADTLVTLQPR